MPSEAGVQGFIAGLKRLGIEPRQEAELVVFDVSASDGAYAGDKVETGVSSRELGHWPQVPPHWVHLPSSIHLPHTNSRESSLAGWLRHSRNIKGWGDASEPAQAWVAHVRGVLGEAT